MGGLLTKSGAVRPPGRAKARGGGARGAQLPGLGRWEGVRGGNEGPEACRMGSQVSSWVPAWGECGHTLKAGVIKHETQWCGKAGVAGG